VFNKIDLLPEGEGAALARQYGAVAISALDKSTAHPLVERMEEALFEQARRN
jgi:50S ribosomal subunit-associated GTPase HflX